MIRLRPVLVAMMLVIMASPAWGYNKLRTMAYDWRILKTEHFDIYYYPEEEKLARRSAILAEKAYWKVSEVMDYYPKARTPLFIYRNHVEFQQTNISRGVIGPGTGGFTEAFKNRVVLPTTGSDRWLETVITHEFVHAIQFNILYGEGTRSFHVFKNYVIPLWMMEGMAEYGASNWDNYADMVMRDGVIRSRVPSLFKLDGFDHLEEVYLAYKAGQTAIQFLADTYGAHKVPSLMKKFKAQISVSQVLRDLTGKSFGAFDAEWRASLNQKYWLQLKGKKSSQEYGQALTFDDSRHITTNNGPAWAPDGSRLAFVSTRSTREQVWIMDKKGQHPKVLFGGPFAELGRSGGYGVSGNRLGWSPDGKLIAFVVVKRGLKRLAIGNVDDGDITIIKLPFDDLSAPSFSPAGDRIAFAGFSGGDSEIYTCKVDGTDITPVTSGNLTSMTTDPGWSRDGKWMVYSGEVDRKNRVFLIRPDGTERRQISRDTEDAIMPDFDLSGRYVYYSSDFNGIYNLTRHDLDSGDTMAMTDVKGGVFHPRISPDGREILFVSYEDACQNIYRMDVPGFIEEPPSVGIQALINPYKFMVAAISPTAEVIPDDISFTADIFAEYESETGSASAQSVYPSPEDALGLPVLDASSTGLKAAPVMTTSTAAALPVVPYKLDISPDLFFMLVGYDSLNGLVGGGYLTGSDMLGNHNLSLFVNFVPGFQSVAQADYTFLKKPVTMGIATFFRNTNFFLRDINPQQFTTTFEDRDIGGQLFFQYPYSRFTRFDFGIGSRFLDRKLAENSVLDPTLAVTLGKSVINSVSAGLNYITLTMKNFEPYSGHLLSLSTSYSDRFLGGTRNFVFHQGQYRGALPLSFISRDAVASLKMVTVNQTGKDRFIFYFGGVQVRGLSYTHTLQQQFTAASFELRHPYLKNINGRLWPLNFFLIKDLHVVFFYDIGAAVNDWDNFDKSQLRSGWGGGFRLHTFAFDKVLFNWRLDIASRTDRPDRTYYYFTLGQVF